MKRFIVPFSIVLLGFVVLPLDAARVVAGLSAIIAGVLWGLNNA